MDKLSVEWLEKFLATPFIPGAVIPMNRNHAQQLLDTLRSINEALALLEDADNSYAPRVQKAIAILKRNKDSEHG